MDVNNPDGLTSAEIIFEEVWPSGAGGATRLDTGERVFISKSFVKRSALNPGDCAVAHIVPNDPEHSRSGVAWRAVYCTRIGPFSEAVINDLREVTIEEIFEAIASDPKAAASLSFRAADAAIKRIAELEAELDAIRSRGEKAA